MAYLKPAAGQAREAAAGTELDTLLDAIPLAAIADLTAASGTADGTVADVGGAFNQGTLNNNFQDLATKINLILARLRSAGIIS